jgi:hypothetical protein
MIVDKYDNYVRKFMWQLCGWCRVDILTFHKREFDFFYLLCITNSQKIKITPPLFEPHQICKLCFIDLIVTKRMQKRSRVFLNQLRKKTANRVCTNCGGVEIFFSKFLRYYLN